VKLVRSIVREVAGYAPYEKRIMEILKGGGNNPNKRAWRFAKNRLGTHKRAKKKVSDMVSVNAQMAQRQAVQKDKAKKAREAKAAAKDKDAKPKDSKPKDSKPKDSKPKDSKPKDSKPKEKKDEKKRMTRKMTKKMIKKMTRRISNLFPKTTKKINPLRTTKKINPPRMTKKISPLRTLNLMPNLTKRMLKRNNVHQSASCHPIIHSVLHSARQLVWHPLMPVQQKISVNCFLNNLSIKSFPGTRTTITIFLGENNSLT